MIIQNGRQNEVEVNTYDVSVTVAIVTHGLQRK